MDERITVSPGFAEGKTAYSCPICGNEMRTQDTSFATRPANQPAQDCCSMACARKALGVEEECPYGPEECSECHYSPSVRAYPACANYEPKDEAEEKTTRFCVTCDKEMPAGGPCFEAEPLKHTICSSLAVEPDEEAEVWTWGHNSAKDTGRYRRVLTCGDDPVGQYVLNHQGAWDISKARRDLIADAPQTAKELKAAQADNVRLERDYDFLTTENAALRAEIDELGNALVCARSRAGFAIDHLDDGAPASEHLKASRDEIDAALGKENA